MLDMGQLHGLSESECLEGLTASLGLVISLFSCGCDYGRGVSVWNEADDRYYSMACCFARALVLGVGSVSKLTAMIRIATAMTSVALFVCWMLFGSPESALLILMLSQFYDS